MHFPDICRLYLCIWTSLRITPLPSLARKVWRRRYHHRQRDIEAFCKRSIRERGGLKQQCQARLEERESTALTHSRTLQDLGQWWCLPGPETRLLKRSDAEEAAKVAPDVVSLKELEEKWTSRHRALRKPPAVKKRGTEVVRAQPSGALSLQKRLRRTDRGDDVGGLQGSNEAHPSWQS